MLNDHDKQHLLEYLHYFGTATEVVVVVVVVETSIGLVHVMPNGNVIFDNELIWNTNDDA